MVLTIYTLLHVVLSLIGIGSGFVVMYGLLTRRKLDGWTKVFLWTTVATSLTGFGFPVDHFMPSHAVGILSLLVLAVAIVARYRYHLAGVSRWVYVIGAVAGLYFNVFVLIVQSFLKIPPLRALAPTQSELPFVVTQATVLMLFALLAIVAVIRFHDVSLGSRQNRKEKLHAIYQGR
jgi:hypothetical protein